MPLKRCSKDGSSGWKYGDSGHCYTGPGAKKKAIKQGLSYDGENFKTNSSKFDESITHQEFLELEQEAEISPEQMSVLASLVGATFHKFSYAARFSLAQKKV